MPFGLEVPYHHMDYLIKEKIGELPEVPEPTHDLAAILDAWKTWLIRYRDLALGALAQWTTAWDRAKFGREDWTCVTDKRARRYPCMDWPWPPGGLKPPWIYCCREPIARKRIGV